MSGAFEWQRRLACYAGPDPARSALELALSLGGLGALLALAFAVAPAAPWLALLLTPLGVGFLARLFIVFHDCAHGSFLRSRRANEWLGRALGVLLLTPFGFWRETHLRHHATSGDLERRGVGDIDTLTAAEYAARSPFARWRYRTLRHPLVLFGLAPFYQFALRHRLPIMLPAPRAPLVRSILANDAVLLAAVAAAVAAFGAGRLLLVAPWWLGFATLALWISYVHHQFPGVRWARSAEWRLADAALGGSAFYDLPAPLAWFTGHIGIHHVHHLCPRIPGYRLPAVLREHPALARMNRIGLRQSFGCARLALWDERAERLVSFREAAGS
jgi:omega-6 fatty acid desaturase (delta-12 desaturase)